MFVCENSSRIDVKELLDEETPEGQLPMKDLLSIWTDILPNTDVAFEYV